MQYPYYVSHQMCIRDTLEPMMLVSGVRRSWEIARSRFARIFSFSASISIFSRSASTRACVFMLLVMALVMLEIENIATKMCIRDRQPPDHQSALRLSGHSGRSTVRSKWLHCYPRRFYLTLPRLQLQSHRGKRGRAV